MFSKRPNDASASITWLRLLAVLGGMGLTSSGLAMAKAPAMAELEEPIHTTAEQLLLPQTAPPSAQSNTPATADSPAFSPLRTSPTVGLTTRRSSTNAQRQPAPASVSLIAQQQEAAEIQASPDPAPSVETAPAVANEAPAAEPRASSRRAVPAEISAEPEVPAGYNSVFIDPTDYSVGATKNPAGPALVFSERSTGCQITVQGQSASPQACGGRAAATATAAAPGRTAQAANPGHSNHGRSIQVGPINFSERGVSLGNTTIVSREYLNEKLRPLNVLRRGTQQYVFPLAIPAPITSLFGWRTHPIFGNQRFHAGTDLGAPLGTPVLATRAGRVTVSDFLGGYGLTVILNHDETLESRYAHLSQILVQPGEWVEQGEVVGLVGSTGNSTGPHLHFEMRQLTAQGWMAVDPQEILQYGIANLVQILNNPLQALNTGVNPEPNGAAAPASLEVPYRPAQPNAS
ncbi:MAG TPA: peptidoglycan DD-metalloendopeptidase family protein [Leptolyngbyaceae cyanobacterium]